MSDPRFSEKLPSLQLIWSSSSLGVFKTCPYKYYLQYIEGWKSRGERLAAVFGTHVHTALESYGQCRQAGLSHNQSVHAAAAVALQCKLESPDSKRNRRTLLRTVVWYLDAYQDDPCTTITLDDGSPAVELAFKFATQFQSKSTSETFHLRGYLDRLVSYQGEEYTTDRKTTAQSLSPYYWKQFSPNNQISLYSLAGQIIRGRPVKGVLIDALQIQVNGTSFGRHFAHRTPAQVEEWYLDLRYWFAQAEECALRSEWAMNDESCSKYGGCDFIEICNKDPAVRQNFLEAAFEKRPDEEGR